ALRIAASLDDPEALAQVLLARDYTISAPDNATERFDATSQVLAIAERVGDPVLASRALGLRFKAAMELADVAEAGRALARNQALVADLGQPGLTWSAMHHHATLCVLRGVPEAEAAVAAASEFGRTIAQQEVFPMAHWLWLRQEQGREGEVEEWFRQIGRASCRER